MDEMRTRIIAVLLKSLYNQRLISEDAYHHSLNNLPKALDSGGTIEYDFVESQRGAETGGRI
jgi:hypothetical protein